MRTTNPEIERLRRERDEARQEARDMACQACGANWALWETAVRCTPWLVTRALVEVYPFLAEWLPKEQDAPPPSTLVPDLLPPEAQCNGDDGE